MTQQPCHNSTVNAFVNFGMILNLRQHIEDIARDVDCRAGLVEIIPHDVVIDDRFELIQFGGQDQRTKHCMNRNGCDIIADQIFGIRIEIHNAVHRDTCGDIQRILLFRDFDQHRFPVVHLVHGNQDSVEDTGNRNFGQQADLVDIKVEFGRNGRNLKGNSVVDVVVRIAGVVVDFALVIRVHSVDFHGLSLLYFYLSLRIY